MTVENKPGAETTVEIEDNALYRHPTDSIDVDNYHGVTTTSLLVYLSCFLLSIAQILTLVGSGAFGRIIASFFGNTTEGTWLAQIPVIYVCSIGPPLSQAADYWGRKWLLTIPTMLGLIGCVIIGKASSWNMVVGGQVVNAFGFAVSPLLYAVASEITPRKFRGVAQSGLTIGNGIGAVFCLIFGEWLVNHSASGWRTFFYIIGGVQGVAAVVFAIFYNPPPRSLQLQLKHGEKLRKLDWIGSFLLVSGITLYTVGLSWSQNPYPWRDAHVSASFACGAALLIVFALYEIFVKSDGMFNHALFKRDRNYPLTLLAVFAEGFAFYSVNGYFTFESSILWETNPVLLGTQFSLTFIISGITSIIAAVVIARLRIIRELVVFGFVCSTVFNICMATATLEDAKAVWAFAAVNGLSFGFLLVCLVTAAQLSAPPNLIAIASGLVIGMRSLGASTGLPIFNAIFNSGISKHLISGTTAALLHAGLSPQLLPEVLPLFLAGKAEALFQIKGVTPQIVEAGFGAVKQDYLLSFRYVWVCAGVVTFFAGLLSCFMINPKRDINMHVDAPLEKDE